MLKGKKPAISHAESVLLAVLLFLLGEKSLVLSKLGLTAFDAVFKSSRPEAAYVYEVSLVGVAVGTCAVIVISKYRQKQLEKDNLAILIGLLTATIATILNIADTALFGADEAYRDIPERALFFYVIWLGLFILPLFVSVLERGENENIDLAILGLSAITLIAGFAIGLIVRNAASAVILYGLAMDGATDLNGAFDKLRYNSDTLIILGSVWTVVTFVPFTQKAAKVWRFLYLAAAPAAGYFYAYSISFPGGDPTNAISAERMAVGFAVLSFSAIGPGIWFARRVLERNRISTLKCAALTFLLCSITMFFGVANTQPLTLIQQSVLSVLQGLAGACVPLCVFVGASIAQKWAPGVSPAADHEGERVSNLQSDEESAGIEISTSDPNGENKGKEEGV